MQRSWFAASAFGLAVSAGFFTISVLAPDFLMGAAQDLTVERVRRTLQVRLDGEAVSKIAAERYLESLPAGAGDVKILDDDAMRKVIGALSEEPEGVRLAARETSKDGDTLDELGRPAPSNLERSALELVGEIRVVSAACVLLFGLAFWLLTRPPAVTNDIAARIAACGAALIGSVYSMGWYCAAAALHAYAMPAAVITNGIVLAFVADALFNDLRATRVALEFSRFWP